jgi:hypothetical protein
VAELGIAASDVKAQKKLHWCQNLKFMGSIKCIYSCGFIAHQFFVLSLDNINSVQLRHWILVSTMQHDIIKLK